MTMILTCGILVRTNSFSVIVAPFPDETVADAWIAEKRKNSNGFLGVTDPKEFSFEVLPLQNAQAATVTENVLQQKLDL